MQTEHALTRLIPSQMFMIHRIGDTESLAHLLRIQLRNCNQQQNIKCEKLTNAI